MSKKQPETNPFVSSESFFKVDATWKTEKFGVFTKSAEEMPNYTGSGGIFNAYKIETDVKVQVYTSGLLGMFLQLSSSAKDMMMYILVHLQYNQDYLELNEDKYIAELDISRATFYRAKIELVNRVIIPRTTRKNTYWVNPAYMFRGDRMKMYPDKVRLDNEHPFKQLKAV